MKYSVITLAFLAVLGAGCADRFKPSETKTSPQKVAVEQAFKSSTSTFGEAATSTPPAATSTVAEKPEPVRWDQTEVAWRFVTFSPPIGYWVYSATGSQSFQLVPGKTPAPSYTDPRAEAMLKRVAEFYAVDRDPISFPTWERFELTMAQFACASGDTDETFAACSDKAGNVVRGKTDAGLPYSKFTLPSYRKKDKAFMGNHTYFMVRLGADSDNAILLVVLNEKTGASPAWGLVKSMKMK